jgi:hypothetical protein
MKKPMINVQSFHDGREGKMNSRRQFLKIGGLAVVGSSLFLYSCEEDGITDEEINALDAKGVNNKRIFNLGTGDIAILNYAYILEQLEAAFYTAVRGGDYYAGAPAEEQELMDDLYNHEVIHREFFRTAIAAATEDNPDAMLPDLEFDLSSVDLSSRDQVLATAMALEDTGVGAYNGAGDRIALELYLVLAGKIVSVEARHAAAIRSLINPESADFAGDDIVNPDNGLDIAYDPAEVIEIAGPFIATEFTANQLPEPMTGS